MVEKEKGAAAAIGEIVKAGVSLVTGKKEAPKASPQSKAVDQLKARAEGRPKPKAVPETKKWTEEVVAGLKRGELPPEPQVTRTVIESQQIIAKTQAAKQTQWLVGEKGAPQSELVAQVVADIASSKLTNDPDYLLAKGAQLRSVITNETPANIQAEARHFLQKIYQKVLGEQQAAGRLSLEKTVVHGQNMWTPKIVDSKVQLPQKQRNLFNTIEYNLTVHKLDMAVGGGGRREPAGGGGAGGTPDYKWDAAQDQVPDAPEFQNLKDKLIQYNSNITDLENELSAAKGKHPPDRQEIVETQKRLDDRVIEMLVIEIPAMSDSEQGLINNSHLRANLELYRLDLVDRYIKEGRGWSSLWVTELKMRAYQLNAFKETRKEQDTYNMYRRLLGNRAQEAIDRSLGQNVQYLVNDDYPRDTMALFKEKANWPDIEQETDIPVDPDHPQQHPLYQRMADERLLEEFRQTLVDKLTYPDLLEKNYTSWLLGNLDKMSVGEAGFGEPGIITVLNNRGINTDAFDVLETKLGDMTGPNGEMIVPTSAAQDVVIDEAVEFLYTHKGMIDYKWKAEYGPHEELTRDDIRASVMEVYRLMAITGHRAKILRRHLNPIEGGQQGVNPHPFTSEPSGDNKLNMVIEPMRQFFDRWKVANAVQRVWMETIGRLSARRFGIDAKWKEIVDKMTPGNPEYVRLVKHAFMILNDDKDYVKDQLSVLRFNRVGKDMKFWPERPEDVTKSELLRWLIFRDGTHLAEPHLMAGYTFFEGSWRGTAQIEIYDELFDKNKGVGVLERLNLKVAGIFDIKKGHHAIEQVQEALTHKDGAHPENEGLMVTTARYMPIQVLRALDNKQNSLSENFISRRFGSFDVFHDKFANGLTEDAEGPVSAERRDLFYKRYELRLTMINRGLADWEAPQVPDSNHPDQMIDNPLLKLDRNHPDRLKAKGLPPIDWSKAQQDNFGAWTVGTTDQMAVLTRWCQETGVNPSEFVRVSKELADFALQQSVLAEAVHPLHAQYFLDVRKLDARLHRLDDGPKVWKKIPTDGDNTPVWMDRRRMYIGKWSKRLIAEAEGHGATGGLARYLGDQMNVFQVLVPHLIPLSKAKHPKEFEQHLEPFVDTVVNTGGSDSRANTTNLLTAAYIIPNRIDAEKDFLGITDDSTTMDISINQRVGGKGFKALTLQETDHTMHFGEAVAGEKFHDVFPHTNHEIMKEANLIVVPKIFGREFEPKWPKFMNRFGEWGGHILPDVISVPGLGTVRVNWGKNFEQRFSGTIFPAVPTLWVYRIVAFLGLGAIIGVFEGVNSARKGLGDTEGVPGHG